MAINHRKVRITFFVLLLLCVVGGIASRKYTFENPLTDKYLGDALYAVAVYLLLGIFQPAYPTENRGTAAFLIMVGIEAFQLTDIPYKLYHSSNALYQLAGRALGTSFHWTDIVAYTVGIWVIWFIDSRLLSERTR